MAAQVMGLSGGVWRRTGACPDDGCSGTCAGFTVRTAAGITRTVAASSTGRLSEVGITTALAEDGTTVTTAGNTAEKGGASAFVTGNASEKGGGASCLSSSSTASSCQIRALTRPDPDSACMAPWAGGAVDCSGVGPTDMTDARLNDDAAAVAAGTRAVGAVAAPPGTAAAIRDVLDGPRKAAAIEAAAADAGAALWPRVQGSLGASAGRSG